ncbi:peptidase C13 family protein [Cooperia oncophora]
MGRGLNIMDNNASSFFALPLNSEFQLTAKRLNEALLTMHRQHRFSQLVFYLESCRSGSMFKNILRSNINVLIDAKVPSLVYAITATQSKNLRHLTCEYPLIYRVSELNSLLIGWRTPMRTHAITNINAETLDEQFQIARELTVKSDVMRFGNLSISREPVGLFQGTANAMLRASERNKEECEDRHSFHYCSLLKHQTVLWPSRDVELMHLRNMKQLNPNSTAVDVLINRIEKVSFSDMW